MPLRFNIRHLEHKNLTLEGELAASELELNQVDELIHVSLPVQHHIELERHERSVLAQGCQTDGIPSAWAVLNKLKF